MLKEINKTELIHLIENNEVEILYLYTTMCGTCQLAKKMLDIVAEALSGLTIYQANINYLSDFAKNWEIESVPCLLILQSGEVKEKVYAFHSVDYLFRLLKPYAFK